MLQLPPTATGSAVGLTSPACSPVTRRGHCDSWGLPSDIIARQCSHKRLDSGEVISLPPDSADAVVRVGASDQRLSPLPETANLLSPRGALEAALPSCVYAEDINRQVMQPEVPLGGLHEVCEHEAPAASQASCHGMPELHAPRPHPALDGFSIVQQHEHSMEVHSSAPVASQVNTNVRRMVARIEPFPSTVIGRAYQGASSQAAIGVTARLQMQGTPRLASSRAGGLLATVPMLQSVGKHVGGSAAQLPLSQTVSMPVIPTGFDPSTTASFAKQLKAGEERLVFVQSLGATCLQGLATTDRFSSAPSATLRLTRPDLFSAAPLAALGLVTRDPSAHRCRREFPMQPRTTSRSHLQPTESSIQSDQAAHAHGTYSGLHNLAVTLLKRPEDLARAYQLFFDADALHTKIHGRASGESIYGLACCLALGAGAASDGRADRCSELPPLWRASTPQELSDARMELAIVMLGQAVEAGYVDTASMLSDPDMQILRDSKPETFAATLRRAVCHGGAPTEAIREAGSVEVAARCTGKPYSHFTPQAAFPIVFCKGVDDTRSIDGDCDTRAPPSPVTPSPAWSPQQPLSPACTPKPHDRQRTRLGSDVPSLGCGFFGFSW